MAFSGWHERIDTDDPLKIKYWAIQAVKEIKDYRGKSLVEIEITLHPRPTYCDRGNWIALTHQISGYPEFDHQDGFPRYYFDLDRAKLEMEDMLKKRGF
jgi:hypothetical protein